MPEKQPMKNDRDSMPDGFSDPMALPVSDDQNKAWQDANRSWWESHPMRYDWKTDLNRNEFSREFFDEIDNRFFTNAAEFMPFKKIPFECLIDFSSLKNKDVLEIGVGCGSHAGLLVRYAKSFTGIDLTSQAVKYTTERMKIFNKQCKIIQMDAEKLEFPDASFDYVWSWGVIHHSANTKKILQEIKRVLRPGGTVVTMVYHRNFWHFYILNGFFNGILRGDLFRYKSIHAIQQKQTDGAIARYYTSQDWRKLVSDLFEVNKILIFGSKAEVIPLPGGNLKEIFMRMVPNRFSQFLTNNCKMGSFLVAIMQKKA
jgi:ubiquinone/menaquinone biosynthesis C-methylase UbiE